MRIGIEAQRIFRKKKHGMDIVAIELIRALQETDKENSYYVFVKEDEDDTCIMPTSNFSIIKIRKAPYPYWEQMLLPAEIKKYNLDLLHCTSNTAPLKIFIPLIVTVHDIIYLEKLNFLKGSAYQIFGNLYRRLIVPIIIKKATIIITVSEYEKKVIKDYFPNRNIAAIYNGVGDYFKKIIDNSWLQSIKARYKLPDEFIFYLGNTDPKKNMEGVLKAFSILMKKEKKVPTLLMLDIDRQYLKKLLNKIGDPQLINQITFSGYIPNSELPAIYSQSIIFLYPSFRESFGIPILEAMACGSPVITSNTSSMPEIAGDAAILIDPQDPETLAAAIAKLILDPVLRQELSLKGIERSKNFGWIQNGKKTLLLYKQVHHG